MQSTPVSAYLGPRVRFARNHLGLSEKDLAATLDLSADALVQLEAGARGLSAEELMRLGDATDRDIEFFLDPFHLAGEAQYRWTHRAPAESLALAEKYVEGWVALLRWLRSQSEVSRETKENLFLDVPCEVGRVFSCACQAGALDAFVVNRRELGLFGPSVEVPRLGSPFFIEQLHVALDRGRISARKAARTLGLSLQGLVSLFPEYGLSNPLR